MTRPITSTELTGMLVESASSVQSMASAAERSDVRREEGLQQMFVTPAASNRSDVRYAWRGASILIIEPDGWAGQPR